MSLILDALNKSDSEHSRDNAPSLSSNHNPPILDSQSRLGTGLKYLFGLTALFIILITLYFIIGYLKDNATVSSAVTMRNQQLGTGTSPPAVTKEAKTTTKAQSDKKHNNIKGRLIAAQYKQAEQEFQQAQKTEKKADNADPISTIYSDNPEDITQLEESPTNEKIKVSDDHLKHFSTLSYIGDLPYSVQKNIPTIMYTEHSYQNHNASVTLNKIKRRKGQKITANLYLEEILEDGIIMRYQSRKFRMIALNSWINM